MNKRLETARKHIGTAHYKLTVIDVIFEDNCCKIKARCECGTEIIKRNMGTLRQVKSCGSLDCSKANEAETRKKNWKPKVVPESKICIHCKIDKPISKYIKEKRTRDGYEHRCKQCKNEKYYSSEYHKRYREVNKDKINAYIRKRRSVPSVSINHSMGSMIRQSLKGNKAGRRWESLVGYTLEDLCSHIESLFVGEMSWENFGDIHIDHIIPQSHFEFENEKSPAFQECWALCNLQPRWATTEIAKKHNSDQVGNLNKSDHFIG